MKVGDIVTEIRPEIVRLRGVFNVPIRDRGIVIEITGQLHDIARVRWVTWPKRITEINVNQLEIVE
tara:strand:- start:121 stop:318 length:198 start_codon:yes stop_codon:yes gene_type:complete